MEKIKHFLESDARKDILVVIIVILTGLGSFELGRLSKESGQGGLKVEYKDPGQGTVAVANAISAIGAPAPSVGKNFFASSRGSKYYPISCSAGKTIKQENRIWFRTGEEAVAAGYTLSSACQ